MVRIHIARDGKIIGVHEEHAVPALIALGEVKREDFWWRQGKASWERIGGTFDAPRPAAVSPSTSRSPSVGAVPVKPPNHLRYGCTRCQHRFDEPTVVKDGSTLTEIFYWLVSPIAGGFYTAGRALGTKHRCPKCASEQIVDEPW